MFKGADAGWIDDPLLSEQRRRYLSSLITPEAHPGGIQGP